MAFVAILSEETYQKWRDLALDLMRAGGRPRDLITLLGISEEQWKVFMDAVHEHAQPRKPSRDYPIIIPPTSPTSYVSFRRALNLKLPNEWTGDRHFHDYFFGFPKGTVVSLAGPNGVVDTTQTLGTKGVRDMARIIAENKIQSYNGPIFVANHYRAIADIVANDLMIASLDDLKPSRPKYVLSPWTINDFLNNVQDEIDLLVEDYLKPLRGQLEGPRRDAFERWLPTVACY